MKGKQNLNPDSLTAEPGFLNTKQHSLKKLRNDDYQNKGKEETEEMKIPRKDEWASSMDFLQSE